MRVHMESIESLGSKLRLTRDRLPTEQLCTELLEELEADGRHTANIRRLDYSCKLWSNILVSTTV